MIGFFRITNHHSTVPPIATSPQVYVKPTSMKTGYDEKMNNWRYDIWEYLEVLTMSTNFETSSHPNSTRSGKVCVSGLVSKNLRMTSPHWACGILAKKAPRLRFVSHSCIFWALSKSLTFSNTARVSHLPAVPDLGWFDEVVLKENLTDPSHQSNPMTHVPSLL